MEDKKNAYRHRNGDVIVNGQKGQIVFSLTMPDGRKGEVRESGVKKHGWGKYAQLLKGAKVDMKDNDGNRYQVPLDIINDALADGLSPFTTFIPESQWSLEDSGNKKKEANSSRFDASQWLTQKAKPEGQESSRSASKPASTTVAEGNYQPTFADTMKWMETMGNIGGALYGSEQSRKQLSKPAKPALDVERSSFWGEQPNNIKKAGERVQIMFDEERAMDQTAANLDQKIKAELPKAMKEYTDKFRDEEGNIPFGAFGYANAPVGDDRVKRLEAARDMILEANKIRRAAESGGFTQSFKDALTSDSYWSSFLGAKRLALLQNAVVKEDEGEKLTEDEKILLDAAAYNMYALAVNNPKLPRGYRVGSAVAQSLPFMLEFALNPLSGSSKAIAKKMTNAVLKRFSGIAKKKIANKALQIGSRQLANLGAATGMSATTSVPGIAADAIGRHIGEIKPEITNIGTIGYGGAEGGENIGKAFLKAGAARTIDNWSEMVGSQLGEILPLGKLFKRTKLGKEVMSTSTAKAIKKFEDAVQFHGITEEFAEEMLAGVGNAILVGDQELNTGERGVFNLDNMIDTYLTVAVMGAVPMAGRTAGYAAEQFSTKKLRAADKAAGKAMGESWATIRDQILNASNEARADYLKQIVTSPVFSAEDKKAVLTYVGEVAKREAAAEFKRMKKDDPAYSAYENRKDIINNYNEASAAIGEEQKSEFDNYANYDEWYLQNKDASEEKGDDAYLYFNARQDMYDYVDEMNARIQDRVNARMQEVDNLTNPDTGEVITVASNYYQQPVNIVGGRLVFDEAGNVDAKASDKIIYYVDNNGKRMMATPDKFKSLVSRASAADMRQQVQQEEEAGAWAEEEVEMSQPEIKVGSIVVTPDGKQGVVTEMNSDYVSVNVDGQSLEYAPSEVSVPMPQQAETAPQPVAGQSEVQQIEQSQIQQQEPEVTTQQEGMAGTTSQPEVKSAETSQSTTQTQPDEVQQPGLQAPARQIPQDEKGKFLFTQVPAGQTYAYLYTQEDLTPEESDMIVDQNLLSAQNRMEKLEGKGPKPTPDLSEYRANKAKWEAEKQKAQADLDYWNEVKSIRDRMMEQEDMPGDAEARDVMTHTEPLDGEELAAKLLATGGIKITRDSYLKETGFKPEEARRMFGLFASSEKGGVSIERAGEMLELASRENGYNFFPEGEANAGRDAILSVLQQARTKGDLYRFISNRREEQARREQEAAQAAYADFIMRNFGMTVDEYRAYEEMRTKQVLESYLSEPDKGEIVEEFISEEPVKQEEDGTTEEQQPISTTSETGGEVLQGEQPVYAGGTERTETESGEAGGGVVDENGVTPAEEVEEGKITSSGQVGLIRDEMAEGESDADLIDAIAKKLGVTVRFVEQVAGGAANAQIVGNAIEIEKGNENPVKFLLGHEITHRVQDLASDAYQEFKEYTKRVMGEGFDNAVARMKRAYEVAGIPISNEQLEDEVVADFAGSLSENRGALEKFINQSNPTIWQILKDVFESIKSLFVGERERQINEAVRLLDNALKKAEAKADSEGINAGEKFSVKTINKNNVAQKIYETSGLYLKELNKDGVLGRVVGDNGVINIEAAKKEFSVAEDVLNDYIENLENMKGYATNAAKGVIDDQIKEAKNSIEYYKNLAEGKDVWRTETTRFSLRTKPAPKKTVKAYKLMKVDSNGKLHFPFAMVGQEVPLGVWMDAEDASAVNAKGERKATLTFRGGGKKQAAPRPGFHAGDMPYAAHIGIGGNQQQREKIGAEDVWVEAEMAADVDYQQEATENGRNPKTGKVTASKADIRDRVPVDGFYRYKTNPNMKGQWLIGGSMKLNRVLSDQEVNDILDEMGADVQRMPRDGGNQTQEWFDNINKINLSEGQRFSIRMTPEMETIIEEAKANGTYMKAPNGNPTNLTEGQWAQVRTKAFKDWFGDWINDPANASKIVDDNGEPMVVDDVYLNLRDNNPIPSFFSKIERLKKKAEKIKELEKEIGYSWDDREFLDDERAMDIFEYIAYSARNTSTLIESLKEERTPVLRVAFRYGHINEDQMSYNYRDQVFEKGVSVVGRVAELNTEEDPYYSAFLGTQPYNVVLGIDFGRKGADGEMLLTPAMSLGLAKNIGRIAKSAVDNTGYFSTENPDIRFSIKRKENLSSQESDRLKEDIKSIFGSENISESKAVEGLRKLGILNASTYKGYGRISDEQAEYNNSVYRLKDDILKKAVSLFEEKGWDVGVDKNEGVVFFRGSDGIQISFHTRKFPEEWKDLPERSWDMVPKSYSYNPDRYSQVRDYISERYNQWKKDVEAYQGRIKDSMISYLRNSKRRSSLGIEDSYEDIKNKISSYPSRIDSSFNFSDAELISSPISMPYASREQVVKSVESEVGDKPKKFNPEEEVEIAKERFSIKSSYDVFEELGKSGMKGLLGEQFSDTMIGLHSGLPKKVKDGIYEYSMSRYSDALSNVETASEAISQAISGYLGHMAEESPEASWWEKVCGSVRKNLKDMGVKLNDNDIRYMFWLSNKDRSVLKPEPQPIIPRDRYEEKPISFSEEEIAKLPAMDAVEEVRFSIRMNQTDKESLEQKIKNHKFREGWQDRMISLRDFQEAIAKMSGKKVRDSENAYDFENTVSGIVTYDYENYKQNYMSKITEAIRNLTNGGKADAAARVREYMKAKHGMERNALMRQRAIDKREQEIIKELGGKITPDNQALFDDKMNKKRKAEARTDYAGLTGLYNRLAKPQSKPTMADIEAYMTNLVNDYEKNHDSGKVKALWDSVRNATGYVLDYLVKTNVMDKEGAEKIKGQYSNYIPLREWQEGRAGDRYTYYSEHGADAFSNPIIRAEGRTTESGDPLASIELMALSSFFMGQKNMMKLRLLRLVRNRPSELANVSKVWYVKDATGQWVETVPDISGAKTEEEIADIIDQFEKDMEAKKKTKDAVQKRSKLDVGMAIVKREAKQHQVRVKELGVDYIINFNMDPSVAQAVNGLNRVNMPVSGFFGLYSKFKRYLTSSMTSYNVDFIPINALRDAESSTMNAFIKDGFARLWGVAKNVPKSFYDLGAYIYAGKLSPQLKEFLENGGETGYASLRKYEALRDELEKEISRYKKSNRVKDFFKAFGSILSMINRQIENTMRYATFLASKKAGKSILESIKDAKNSSTNFDRKGSGQMGYVIANQMFFFLNPSIQSLRYKFHLFKEYPIRSTIAHAFWAGMALLIPATCWRGNEETYRSIPEYVRRGNMCIPDGNEGYVTLPLSYDLKPAFVLGDILYGYANGTYKGDEDLAVRDAILAVSEMSPRNFLGGTTSLEDAPSSIVYNFIPDMIGPIADVMRNQTFSGRPIYRNEDYLKYVPEYRKVYKGTPDFMVNASKWLNEAGGGNYATKGSWDYSFLNPAVLEYVFMGYVGGAVPSYWRGFKSAYNKLNEEYVATNDIPIVRRFYKDWQNQNGVPNDNITQRYFDYSEKVRKFESEWNQYLSGMKEPSLSEEDRAKLLEGFPKHASSQDMVMIKSIIQYTDEMVDNFREVQAVSTEEQVKKMEQEIYKARKDAVTKIEEILKSKEE